MSLSLQSVTTATGFCLLLAHCHPPDLRFPNLSCLSALPVSRLSTLFGERLSHHEHLHYNCPHWWGAFRVELFQDVTLQAMIPLTGPVPGKVIVPFTFSTAPGKQVTSHRVTLNNR